MSHHGRPLSSQVASRGNRAPSNDKLAAIEDPFDLIQAINQTPRISFSARFESQPQPLAERNYNAPPPPIIPPDFYYEKPFKRSKVTTKLPSTRGSLGWDPYKSDAERIRERRRMKNAARRKSTVVLNKDAPTPPSPPMTTSTNRPAPSSPSAMNSFAGSVARRRVYKSVVEPTSHRHGTQNSRQNDSSGIAVTTSPSETQSEAGEEDEEELWLDVPQAQSVRAQGRGITPTPRGQSPPKDATEEPYHTKHTRFTTTERKVVDDYLDEWNTKHNLGGDELLSRLPSMQVDKLDPFWSKLCSRLPLRHPRAVRQHVVLRYSPHVGKGPWSETEDQLLTEAVAESGTKWKLVSVRVGRTAADCARRWVHNVRHQSTQGDGPWSPEEEENLSNIVIELTKGGALKDPSCQIPWSEVLARINHRRTLCQCRGKWEYQRKRLRNNGVMPRWTSLQHYYLVQQVSRLDVTDITFINWRRVVASGHEWNDWTPRETRRHFVLLMRTVEGHARLPFKDIMAVLLKRYATPPARAVSIRGKTIKVVKKH